MLVSFRVSYFVLVMFCCVCFDMLVFMYCAFFPDDRGRTRVSFEGRHTILSALAFAEFVAVLCVHFGDVVAFR